MNEASFAALVLTTLILAFAAVVVWSLVLRYRKRELQHKERLAAMEKGMPLPDLTGEQAAWSPRPYLLRGMMWLFSGVSLTVFLLGIAASTGGPDSLEERLNRAQNLKSLGASEEQITQVENDPSPQHRFPPAAALLGLVPAGLGLAYLIYYRVESKRALPRM
jgi:hypothetical protein